jgi:hypothetical protein
MSNQAYETLRRSDGRFIVSDPATSTVLDDAQGYGYTTKQKAEKAAWYKFKGGKSKQDAAKKEASDFWRANKEFAATVNELYETWFKEIALGEIDLDAEVAELATKNGIDGFEPRFLKYL